MLLASLHAVTIIVRHGWWPWKTSRKRKNVSNDAVIIDNH